MSDLETISARLAAEGFLLALHLDDRAGPEQRWEASPRFVFPPIRAYGPTAVAAVERLEGALRSAGALVLEKRRK